MFKIDFCYVKMKSRLYQVFLKTPTFYTVTAEVIELNNRKKSQKTSCISSQRTIMKQEQSKAKKVLQKLQVQTRVENYFSF